MENNDIKLFEKGIECFDNSEFKEALDFFEKYMNKYPKNELLYPKLLYYKGIALDELNKPKEALTCFNESLKLEPRNSNALNYKGCYLMDVGDFEKAEKCFIKAIKIDPNFILPYYNIAIIKKETKNLEKSIKFFEKVLNIDPEYSSAWLEKGIILKRLNKQKESLESYKKFVEIVEENDIEEDKLRARRVKEYISNQKNDGNPISIDLNRKPKYWQWITRAEYFLEPNGKEREALEPREDSEPGGWWTCHKDTRVGDLVLLYRAGKKDGVTYQDIKYLIIATSDAYPIDDDEYAFNQGWTYGCDYKPIFKFKNSITLNEMKKDPYLDEWNALNGNFNRSVYRTEERHWNRLIQVLKDKNQDYDQFSKEFKSNKIIGDLKTESELEDALCANIKSLQKFGYNLEYVERQKICPGPGGRIDILTKDKTTGEYVVIELKVVKASRTTFGQISEYVGWTMERYSNGNTVKGLVISKGYDTKFKSALNTNPNIQHLELSEVLTELEMKLV